MTSTINSDRTAQQEVRKHPIRGAIWGSLLGLGVATYLVLFAVIAFGDWIPFGICVLAGVALGVAWASVAPPKQPKGAPPARPAATVAEATAASSGGWMPDDDTPLGGPLVSEDFGAAQEDRPTDDPPSPGSPSTSG